MTERNALGKGLEALIPKKNNIIAKKEFAYLPVDKIQPGKYQPRQQIDIRELKDLAQSIKEKGIIQPIVVREIREGQYEIIAGGRRFEAVKSLGIKEIPTIIKELDDKDTLTWAIVENLQRVDLNPIEEAEAFKRLSDEFKFSLDDIAQFVGKDKTTVSNILRLLKLPPNIQEAVRKGIVSRSQARTILAVEDKEEQEKLFHQILTGGLTVRDIEKSVKAISKKGSDSHDPFAKDLEDKIQRILGTKVRIFNKKNNSGKIVIEYYNLEDLERITGRIK